LAGCYCSGFLTAVWIPDEGSEALRDLVRAREAAKQNQMRARHGLSKFLLRSGQRPPTGVRCWTRSYLIGFAQVRFNQVAQEVTRQEIEHMRLRPSWTRYPVMGYAVGYLAKTPVASESDDRMSSLARPTISSYLSDNHEGRELSTAKRRSFWVLGHLDYRRRSLVYATDRVCAVL
jgi:hypothetical protein